MAVKQPTMCWCRPSHSLRGPIDDDHSFHHTSQTVWAVLVVVVSQRGWDLSCNDPSCTINHHDHRSAAGRASAAAWASRGRMLRRTRRLKLFIWDSSSFTTKLRSDSANSFRTSTSTAWVTKQKTTEAPKTIHKPKPPITRYNEQAGGQRFATNSTWAGKAGRGRGYVVKPRQP